MLGIGPSPQSAAIIANGGTRRIDRAVLLRVVVLSAVLLAACSLPSYAVEVRVANDSNADVVVMASEAGVPPVTQSSEPIAAGAVQTVTIHPDDTSFLLTINGQMLGYWKCWPADGQGITYSVEVRPDGTLNILDVSAGACPV